jgi:hypothetical protein
MRIRRLAILGLGGAETSVNTAEVVDKLPPQPLRWLANAAGEIGACAYAL